MRKLIAPLLGAICVIGAIGCAGSDSPFVDAHNPRVRFLNATSLPTSTTVYSDDEKIANELAFGAISNEAILTNGNHMIDVRNSSTNTTLKKTEATFELDEWYTLIAYTGNDGLTKLVNTRDNKEQTEGKMEVRVVRATDQYGDVDVYIYPTGDPLPSTPTFELGQTGQSTPQIALDLNKSYTLRIFRDGETTGGFSNENVFANSMRNIVFYFTRNAAGNDTLLEFNE
ncbi:MAG: DUF4397 domain-containing protein [Fimbriimonas sp.]